MLAGRQRAAPDVSSGRERDTSHPSILLKQALQQASFTYKSQKDTHAPIFNVPGPNSPSGCVAV